MFLSGKKKQAILSDCRFIIMQNKIFNIHKDIGRSGGEQKKSNYLSQTVALDSFSIYKFIWKHKEFQFPCTYIRKSGVPEGNKKKEQLSIPDGCSRKLYVIQ